MGGPTKEFFLMLSDCIKFLLSGFYKVEGKMSLLLRNKGAQGVIAIQEMNSAPLGGLCVTGCSLPHQALLLPIPWVNTQEWECGKRLSCLCNALMCFDTFRRETWLLLPRRGLRSVAISHSVILPVKYLYPHF